MTKLTNKSLKHKNDFKPKYFFDEQKYLEKILSNVETFILEENPRDFSFMSDKMNKILSEIQTYRVYKKYYNRVKDE